MSRREQIVALLRSRGGTSGVAELAEALGVHPNTVRFHLDRLVAEGLVERRAAAPGLRGRPRQEYTTVRAMDPGGPRNYRLLADVLVTSLTARPRPQRAALEAGRQWGRRHAVEASPPADVVEGLIEQLRDLDFAPERHGDDEPPVIGLRHCPFLELAGARADVVCPVHLGLMRGILESWDAGVTVDRLEPFAEPDLCTAHLALMEDQ